MARPSARHVPPEFTERTGPVAGPTGDLAARVEELTRIRARQEEVLVRHTGRSPAQVTEDVERGTVLGAQQAVEYGLVDRIVTDSPGASPAPRGR
ncbi:ATP-dependent Clp protease proteolytic subunit [Streptomyces parvulus]|uniref:ATP-dependent Clp protease proteolytic subunit n=1 Tax=Streptomyces parvulus TaxID=146923 RepID=UPI00368CE662